MRGRSKAEQETIVRWDEEERIAWLSTTSPAVKARWERKGVRWRVHSTVQGIPCSWAAKVDFRAVVLRRVDAEGNVIKRPVPTGDRKGRFRSAARSTDASGAPESPKTDRETEDE